MITPNEATIAGAVLGAALGALFGGIVSFLTARYTLKHGPNYEKQITNIHHEFHALAKTQEDMRLQMVEDSKAEQERHVTQERKAEAARWKPAAKILSSVQGSEQANVLRLDSSRQFALTAASLISPSGANLYEYPVNGPNVFSSGCSVSLVRESLLLLANSVQPPRPFGGFDGSVRYTTMRQDDGTEYTGHVPFHAETVIVADTLWYKLQG